MLTSKITLALQILDDGKWHQIQDLQETLDLSEYELEKLIIFLSKYDFVMMDKDNRKIKVNPAFQNLLVQNVT